MENGLLIILLCLFVSSSSFLLQSAAPPMSTTTHNYEHLLLDVLLDEKNLRSQLEPRIKRLEDGILAMNTALEQQYNKTDAALEALKQAHSKENLLQQAYTRLQMEFHNLSQSQVPLPQGSTDLERQVQNLSLHYKELAKRNNDLEAQVYNLSLNNMELTKRNNDVETQVHNLSLNNMELTKRNNDLEIQVHNLSLNNMELTKRNNDLEAQVHNLSLNNMELTKRNNDLEAQVLNLSVRLDTLTKRDSDMQVQVHNLTKELASVDYQLLSTTINNSIYHAELLELKQKQGYQSGFTVTSPLAGPSAGTITFTGIISNIGNQFNSTTGKFSCVYPGVYVFTLSLYQSYGSHNTLCAIRRNGVSMITVISYSGPYVGYYQASKQVILHLKKGDMVSLEACSTPDTIDPATTFSGFLLNND